MRPPSKNRRANHRRSFGIARRFRTTDFGRIWQNEDAGQPARPRTISTSLRICLPPHDHFDLSQICRLSPHRSGCITGTSSDCISFMKTRTNVIWASCCLLLLGYAVHLTYHVGELESRIQRLEASQEALGRYTYDFGSALIQPAASQGPSPAAAAQAVLLQMRHDDLTRSAVFGSRYRSFQGNSPTYPRNAVPVLVQ